MGTVILRKKDKTIKIPFLLFKILTIKDYVFNDDIYDITFSNCKFNRNINIELEKYQSINLINCNFRGKCFRVIGGNVYIDDTSVGIGLLELCCKSVCLKNINEVNRSRKVSKVCIFASDVQIIGNIEVLNWVRVYADNLSIKDTEIIAEDIDLSSIKLSIKNSLFESFRNNVSLSYKFLDMKDASFFSEKGNVEFFDIIGGNYRTRFYRKPVVSYKKPVALTDSDILADNLYLFLSVLKGYNNKIKSINDKDVRDTVDKIDIAFNKEIKELEEEKEKLINDMKNSKKEAENNLSKRKVKSLMEG